MMKRILALAVVIGAAALAVMPANAQTGYDTADSTLNAGTNNVAATATNSYTTGCNITVTKQSIVAIEIRHTGSASGTGNLRYDFERSIDQVSWVPHTNVLLAFAGATPVTNIFDIACGGNGYLRLKNVGNTNAIYGTNLFMQYAVKKGL